MTEWADHPEGGCWVWVGNEFSARVHDGLHGAYGTVIHWSASMPGCFQYIPIVNTVRQAMRVAQAIIFHLRGLHVGKMEPARAVRSRGD